MQLLPEFQLWNQTQKFCLDGYVGQLTEGKWTSSRLNITRNGGAAEGKDDQSCPDHKEENPNPRNLHNVSVIAYWQMNWWVSLRTKLIFPNYSYTLEKRPYMQQLSQRMKLFSSYQNIFKDKKKKNLESSYQNWAPSNKVDRKIRGDKAMK